MEGDMTRLPLTGADDNWPRIARRIVWSVVVLDLFMLAVIVVSAPIAGKYSSSYGGGVTKFLFPFSLVASMSLGALIAIRRPHHPVGWLLLASATAFMIDQGLIQNFVIYAIHVRNRAIPGGDLVGSIESMMWVPGIAPIAIFLPLVFPTGNLLSRRWRPVLWVAIVAMIAAFVGNGLSPSTDTTSYIAGVRPVLLPEPFSAITGALSGAIVVLPLCAIAGIVALVVRYRRGTPDERHQIKWMLFAGGFYAFGFAGSLVPGMLGHNIPILEDFGVLGLVLVPVAAAIAVLKYRLYDIDRLISRTVSYALVTGLLIGVYVGLVALATRVLPFSSPLGVAASTLAAAALFNPLRKRVQRLVDHRFNRARYDAEATVAAFAQRVRDDVDLDAVSSEFVRAVQASVEPAHVSLWLRPTGSRS
jgi:hypothetical protein